MNRKLVVLDNIKDKIHTIRGLQVIIDRDIAQLYEVEVKYLKRQVKRNQDRFPSQFMFELSKQEFDDWRCQNVTSKADSKGLRHKPFAFTEQGVSMLSTVLKSAKSIDVSIRIIDAFVSMRKFIAQNADVFKSINFINYKLSLYDEKFEEIFKLIEDKQVLPQKGIFFEGEVFKAHSFISDLIRSAKHNIVLIDNYVDDSVLKLFSKKKKDVSVIIYTNNITDSLVQSADKFNKEYGLVLIKKFNKSHDRFLIIDKDIYHVGASLKDLGKKWFAFSKFKEEALTILNKLHREE